MMIMTFGREADQVRGDAMNEMAIGKMIRIMSFILYRFVAMGFSLA